MTDNGDVLLQQTEDGHHRFVDAPTPMPHPFTVGAQVELKSGGPVMTVEALEDLNDEIVHLVWFVGGTPVRDAFHCSMLKLAGDSLDTYLVKNGMTPASKPEKRPVAWRVGMIIFTDETAANVYVGNELDRIECLYLRDGT